MKITICSFEELPEWVDRDRLPNNGSGKEYASYLVIEDGDYQSCRSDAMEPEDARLSRDLKWIKSELERASNSMPDRVIIKSFFVAKEALENARRFVQQHGSEDDSNLNYDALFHVEHCLSKLGQ